MCQHLKNLLPSSCMTSHISLLFLLFSHHQMRLPLRSFCIFRSVIARGRAAVAQRRGLSGAAMRLVQFQRRDDDGGRIRVGVEQGEGLGVVDLKAFDPSMPSTMRELLELGDEGLQCAQRCQKLLRWVVQFIYASSTHNSHLSQNFHIIIISSLNQSSSSSEPWRPVSVCWTEQTSSCCLP